MATLPYLLSPLPGFILLLALVSQDIRRVPRTAALRLLVGPARPHAVR